MVPLPAGRPAGLPFFRDVAIADAHTVARFARAHAALSGGPATASVLDQDVRLPLGNDAADAVADSLDRLRAEFLAWEPVSRGTDLDPV